MQSQSVLQLHMRQVKQEIQPYDRLHDHQQQQMTFHSSVLYATI